MSCAKSIAQLHYRSGTSAIMGRSHGSGSHDRRNLPPKMICFAALGTSGISLKGQRQTARLRGRGPGKNAGPVQ